MTRLRVLACDSEDGFGRSRAGARCSKPFPHLPQFIPGPPRQLGVGQKPRWFRRPRARG